MEHEKLPLSEIGEFCRRWGVEEFSLFGSILRDDFGPESDVDVLVHFHSGSQWGLFDLSLMVKELEQIFGRRVDLLTRRGINSARNARRRDAILSSARVVYVA